MTDFLNPGSPEARDAGCKCPVLDNCRGKGHYGIPGKWVLSGLCPLHNEEGWPGGWESLGWPQRAAEMGAGYYEEVHDETE